MLTVALPTSPTAFTAPPATAAVACSALTPTFSTSLIAPFASPVAAVPISPPDVRRVLDGCAKDMTGGIHCRLNDIFRALDDGNALVFYCLNNS